VIYIIRVAKKLCGPLSVLYRITVSDYYMEYLIFSCEILVISSVAKLYIVTYIRRYELLSLISVIFKGI